MMRKSLMILLAALFVMFVTSIATAQEKEGKAGAEPVKPAAKAHKADKLHTVLAELKLTDEQKTKVDGIIADYEAKLKEAKGRSEKAKVRREMYEEICGALNEEQKPKFEKEMGIKPSTKTEEKKEGAK